MNKYVKGVIIDIIPLPHTGRKFDVQIAIRRDGLDDDYFSASTGCLDDIDRQNLVEFPQEFLHKKKALIEIIPLQTGGHRHTTMQLL